MPKTRPGSFPIVVASALSLMSIGCAPAALGIVLAASSGGGGGAGKGSPGAPSQHVIGPAGGTTVQRGVAIGVPAGAVQVDTVFTISRGAEIAAGEFVAVGSAFQLGPSGTRFARAVSVTLPYEPAAIPAGKTAGDVVVLHRDDASMEVTTLTGVVDPAAKKITIQLRSFCTVQPAIRSGVDPTKSTVTVDRDSAVADGRDQVQVTVRVLNAAGRPIPNRAVSIVVSGSGNTITPLTPTSSDGVVVALLASTVAETKTVSVSVEPGGIALLQEPSVTFTPNTPPALSFSSGLDLRGVTGAVTSFSIAVSDPESRQGLTLRLLNVPPGCAMAPVEGAGAVSASLTWRIPRGQAGAHHLVFEASDGVATIRSTVRVQVTAGIGPARHHGVVVGDVTSDGILDVIGTARNADVGGVSDAGAVYVWAGASAPSDSPTATLRVPGASPSDILGVCFDSQGVQLGDLTGGGILDVVVAASFVDTPAAVNAGAIYLWAGGSALSGTLGPLATLQLPTGAANDFLAGLATGLSVQLDDVTGDGILDVVVASSRTDVGGVVDTGAVFVWRGGPGLVGAVDPTALLRVANARASDHLGTTQEGQGVYVVDVTGDGINDVVAAALFADHAGVQDSGAIYVWRGGVALEGLLDPTATLYMSEARAGDQLTSFSGQGVVFGDVTGDGVTDVVSGSRLIDFGVVADSGCAFVWAGGASLLGAVTQTATLVPSSPRQNDRMTECSGQGLLLADVTGDGTLDVIAGAQSADTGNVSNTVANAGKICVWRGGPSLVGPLQAFAVLAVPTAVAHDSLGFVSETARGIHIVDLDADGVLDIIGLASYADVGGQTNSGANYMWRGGSTLVGRIAPNATLQSTRAQEALGAVLGEGVLFADVSGDGVLDAVVVAESTNTVYVWTGGSGLNGVVSPTATLQSPSGVLRLGRAGKQGLHVADVTGDGTPDVIAGSEETYSGNVAHVGAIYVWAGGATMQGTLGPTAALRVPGALGGDLLGQASGIGFQFTDLTSDGVLDIVVGAQQADVGGRTDVGAVYVWAGGSVLNGAVAPTATMTVPGAASGDRLGFAGNGQGVVLADVTGDGAIDLVGAAAEADVGGLANTGALFFWRGGTGIVGPLGPTARWTVPGAAADDGLGN